MPVKYIYKNHKPVAQIWTKESNAGYVFVAGAVSVALIAAGLMWWKINRG